MAECFYNSPGYAALLYKKKRPVIVLLFLATVMLLQSCGSEPDFSFVTSFDRDFPGKWTHTPSGSPPVISNTDTVYAGIPFALQVFFRKYARTSSGKVDLAFAYKILGPDSSVFYDTSGIVVFSGVVNKDSIVLLSRSIPAITFSQKENPGNYRLMVTVEDRIAGEKKMREKVVVLAPYPEIGHARFDGISFNVWVHSYCIAPDPARAVQAFFYFIHSKQSNNDVVFWPVFYFFQCLFRENPALVSRLKENVPNSSGRFREYTVFLLRAIQYKKSVADSTIPDSLWNKFDKVTRGGYLDPFSLTFETGSNRLMEFGFYYYGSYSMIRFLIDCLSLGTPLGYKAFIARCNDYGEECTRSLTQGRAERLYTEAAEILKKTCSRHQLVNAYCRYALHNDSLYKDGANMLREIVAAAQKK